MTMLRFEPEQRVGYREYMRSDGTRSYFFCLDSVRNLFCGTGFTEVLLPVGYFVELQTGILVPLPKSFNIFVNVFAA